MTTKTEHTAAQVRQYIKTFREHKPPCAEYADFPSGRVHFDNMTDEQAVVVAVALMDIEAQAIKGMGGNDQRRKDQFERGHAEAPLPLPRGETISLSYIVTEKQPDTQPVEAAHD